MIASRCTFGYQSSGPETSSVFSSCSIPPYHPFFPPAPEPIVRPALPLLPSSPTFLSLSLSSICVLCVLLSLFLSHSVSLYNFFLPLPSLSPSLSLSLSLALWLYLTRAPSFLILHVGPPNRRTIPHTPAMFHFFARLSRNSNSRCNYNPAL